MRYQVLARKWRPRNFQHFVGQNHVVRALENALNQNRLHHAYLFTGTRGVGKTTLARIFAKCLNCEDKISSQPCEKCATCQDIDAGRFVDLLEVDAASRTKVEDTRELLDNVSYAATRGRYKIYLIDEVHMLSNHSFNALLKTLEEPPEHVKFLFATTDPQKLPATIRSRCLQFHLRNISLDQIISQLIFILEQENIPFEKDALHYIARAANGSMRDALSLLDQAIAYGDQKINTSDVRMMLGFIENDHLFILIEAIKNQDAQIIVDQTHRMYELNCDFNQALEDLLSHLHRMTILKMLPNAISAEDPETNRLRALAEAMQLEDIQLYYQMALNGKRDLILAPSPYSGFEMTLLRMLAFHLETIAAANTIQTNNHYTSQLRQPKSSSKNLTEPPSDITPSAENITDWQQLLERLTLTGPNRILASHCVLKTCQENLIELQLDPSASALLNPLQKESLQKSLSDYFKRPIQLNILVEKSVQLTPMQVTQQENSQRREKAAQALKNDPQVQSLLNTFSATIKPDTIEPID